MRTKSTFIIACIMSLTLVTAWADRAGAAPPENANVRIDLHDALSHGGDHRANLWLEFQIRDGKWSEDGWGWAISYNRGHHEATVVKNEVVDGVRIIEMKVNVAGDPWISAGKVTYTVKLKPDGDRLVGTHQGQVAVTGPKGLHPDIAPERKAKPKKAVEVDKETADFLKSIGAKASTAKKDDDKPMPAEAMKVSGIATATFIDPWPGEVKGYIPLKAGEHPRLIFRKADVPRLRRLATETDSGKAIMRKLMSELNKKQPQQGDKFSNWPAVGYGFAYQMTGDAKYAEEAKKVLIQSVFENPAGRGGRGIGQDIHHAPRLLGIALAFDLCYDAWDDEFRQRCIDDIELRVRECALGAYRGRKMSGFNPNWWSNHNGIRMGAAGVGALALLHEEGADHEDMQRVATLAAREMRGYLEDGLGGSGYGMEGHFYKGMTIRRGFAHALVAYETALGERIDRGTLGDFTLVGYFLEAPPGQVFYQAQKFDGGSSVDGEEHMPMAMTLLFNTVPDDMKPGMKFIFDRTLGLQGDKTFGVQAGIYAPYIMANYPWDIEAKEPGKSLRWMAPDPRMGHWIFRPNYDWKDKSDILMVLNMKSQTLRGCHYERSGPNGQFTLRGLGHEWIDGIYLPRTQNTKAHNEHRGGVTTTWSNDAQNNICTIEWDMSPAYYQEKDKRSKPPAGARTVDVEGFTTMIDHGIKARRWMLVDASGKSGAPLLVAIVDRLSTPEGKGVSWSLPLVGKVITSGNRYRTGAPDQAHLAGVLLGGELLDSRAAAEGKGDFFTVFTLQPGKAPEMLIKGEGIDAVVKIGDRTVRFDKGKLIAE